MTHKPSLIFITGPTAVGKTDVAFQLAEKTNGEIVSCDSMQVYKEVSIASNKPNAEELKCVPQHMIDVTSVYDEFDVCQYVNLATQCIDDILQRNRVCIVCGGTGLYLEGLIDGVFEGPKADWDLRGRLEALAKTEGNQILHDQLRAVDSVTADKLHLNDVRRIIRALEVYEKTGQPISYWQQQRRGLAEKYDCRIFVLGADRDQLYQKIDGRVEDMMRRGLIDEVQALDEKRISKTARQLIGIKETLMYLNGEINEEQLTAMIQQNSRNYAKRQLTWFRKDTRFTWIDVDNKGAVSTIFEVCNE